LFSRSTVEDSIGFIENIKLLNEVECRRNWRSFLSVSKTPSWSEIRKQCMIWCLHGYRSEKYLRDESFKRDLNARMRVLSSQLNLTFTDRNPLSSTDFTQLPDIEKLHTLTLVNCSALTSLGSMNSLKILIISGCENLTSVGKMARLTYLRLKTTTGRKDLLQFVPLENLRTLHLDAPSSLLLEFNQNVTLFNLLELSLRHIFPHGYRETDLPIIRLPSLVRLKVMGFRSIDLSGFSNLKVLNYGDTPPQNIKNQQHIIRRLEKLSGFDDLFFDSTLDFPNLKLYECCLKNFNHWEKIRNIRELCVEELRDLKEKT
jgi:hypothetical protein